MLTLPPLPSEVRLLGDSELSRLRSTYPNLATPRNCVTCRGTGEFRWHPPSDRRAIETYKCSCRDQWTLHTRFLSANIGLAYQRLGWDDVGAEPGAVDKVAGYQERAEDYVRTGFGLILYGSAGTGKTLLSILLLKHLIAEGYDGYFTTFSEMIDTYTGGWYDADERRWFHRRIKNTQVLVLDDVGREYQGRAKGGLPESTFDEVLRHRVASAIPTIVTTNLDLDAMQKGYGGNVMSLLRERSSTYRFTGEDYRDRHRLRTDEEIQQGLIRPVVVG